jgi:hypothetical protein
VGGILADRRAADEARDREKLAARVRLAEQKEDSNE